MTAAIRVLNPGLMTTVQDLGRIGYQRLGVPVSGALDPIALRAANVVVRNPQSVAGLEMAAMGPTLELEAAGARIAVAGEGAEMRIERAGGGTERVPALQSVRIARGDRVRIVLSGGSAVACLAIEGGLRLPAFLGSLSTYARGGFGGLEGRMLRAGDLLPLASDDAEARREARLPGFVLSPPAKVRVVLGPQDDYFTAEAIATFLAGAYTVTRDADRMGLRLEGPQLAHAKGYNIVSDGIAPGSIQVPGTCQPIVLLADRQTTGGYPKIATVISADLPAVGRVVPGMSLRFEAVTVAEAQALRIAQETAMKALATRLVPVAAEGLEVERLYDSNLVGGVVCAYTSPAEWAWLEEP